MSDQDEKNEVLNELENDVWRTVTRIQDWFAQNEGVNLSNERLLRMILEQRSKAAAKDAESNGVVDFVAARLRRMPEAPVAAAEPEWTEVNFMGRINTDALDWMTARLFGELTDENRGRTASKALHRGLYLLVRELKALDPK